MTACKKHSESPVKGYNQCAGCEIETLRAENAKLRTAVAEQGERQEAVGTVRSGKYASGMPWCEVEWHVQPEPPNGTALYTTPQPGPDVRGLVEALEQIVEADWHSSETATDFAISQDKGLLIAKIKRAAKAALLSYRKNKP